MTQEELEAEEKNPNPMVVLPQIAKEEVISHDEDTPTLEVKFLKPDVKKESLNFSQGLSAYCAENIIRECDKHAARKRIKEDKQKGKSLEEQVKELKK